MFKKTYKKWYDIYFSSGISFGLWHVVGYDQSLIQYLYVFTYSAIGIGLSYVYAKTNNLTTNIGMHFIHNVLANLTNLLI